MKCIYRHFNHKTALQRITEAKAASDRQLHDAIVRTLEAWGLRAAGEDD